MFNKIPCFGQIPRQHHMRKRQLKQMQDGGQGKKNIDYNMLEFH